MQFSFATTSALLAILSALPLIAAAPATPAISENLSNPLMKRQRMPNNINIGLNDKRYNADTGKSMWTAWVNGHDPCHHHTDLGVYEDQDSPCNIRFSLDDMDFQYSMQGCGGDLSIWKNGVENLGSCDWAPGHVGCVAGAGYTGRWQCHLNV